MNETKKPAIRFCEFSGEWKQYKLGEICSSFEYGLNAAAKVFDGENKYIRITDIDDSTRVFLKQNLTSPDCDLKISKNYQLQDGDIVFARTGASVGKTFIYKKSEGTVYYAGFLIRAKLKSEFYPDFVFYNTLTNKYGTFIQITSQRSGQPGVNAQEYAAFEFYVPIYSEQKKIGKHFRDLDNIIIQRQSKLEKLQSLKAAMLEKMFPKDGAEVPEIRFNGFTGSWKTVHLKDIVSEITRTDKTSNAPIMMITATNGFINQSDRYSFDNAGQSLAKYILLKKGELAYNHGASKLRPYGSCFALESDEARIPYVYHCFAIRGHNPYFVSRILNNKDTENQLRRLITSGARMDGLLNISYKEYTTIKIKLPEKEEQDKIEAYFKNIEHLIAFSQQQLEKLQSIKKALLEKMFV